MRLDLAGIIAGAFETVTSLGLTGSLTLTIPPTVDGKTGLSTGTASSQTVDAVEMTAQDISQQPGEAWTRATAGVFVEAAKISGSPLLTWQATWASQAYQIVAIQPMNTTGVPLTYAIGLAV